MTAFLILTEEIFCIYDDMENLPLELKDYISFMEMYRSKDDALREVLRKISFDTIYEFGAEDGIRFNCIYRRNRRL